MQELILYTQDAPTQLPEDRVVGWYLIARGKVKMDGILEEHTKKLQAIVMNWPLLAGKDYADNLRAAKTIHSSMVLDRKKFTAVLDLVKEKTMESEKAAATEIGLLEIKELEWRRAESAKQEAENNKNLEIASFRAHVQNQYESMVMKYRQDIRTNIHIFYTNLLKAKTPPDQLKQYEPTLVATCQNVRPFPPTEFKCVLLKKEELPALASNIPAPNWKEIWDALMVEMLEKFSMYANDLGAADVVIEQETINLQHQIAQETQQVASAAAVNDLVARGTVYQAEKVVVKKNTKILVKDEDTVFVMAVMSAFISNFQAVMPLIKVKYGNLNIKQMCDALDKAGVQLTNVEYTTIEK